MHDPPVQRCFDVASRQLRPFPKKPLSEECSGDGGEAVGGGTATGSALMETCWLVISI